jgi:hypothetical protein
MRSCLKKRTKNSNSKRKPGQGYLGRMTKGEGLKGKGLVVKGRLREELE